MTHDRFYLFVSGAAFAIAVAVTAEVKNPYFVQVVVWMSLNAMLALGLRFMLLVGEVNLGVGGFFGVGAYTAAVCAVLLNLPTLVAIMAGATAASLLSLPFGYLTLRVSGHYFMLVSFALTEVLRLVYTQSSMLGGNSGMVGIVPSLPAFPTLIALVAGVTFVVLLRVERSHFGRIVRAVADSEKMVEAIGIPVSGIKLRCLVISAFVAGLAGSLFAFANTVIAPGDFGFLLPVFALAYVKIGGQSHPTGAIIGTVLMSVLGQMVISLGAQDTMLFGAAIVLIMLFLPEGLLGLIDRHIPDVAGAGKKS